MLKFHSSNTPRFYYVFTTICVLNLPRFAYSVINLTILKAFTYPANRGKTGQNRAFQENFQKWLRYYSSATAGDVLGTENLYKSRTLLKCDLNLRHFYDRWKSSYDKYVVKEVKIRWSKKLRRMELIMYWLGIITYLI